MAALMILLIAVGAPLPKPGRPMPPANELVEQALRDYRTTPLEERREGDLRALVSALIDLGRRSDAYELARSDRADADELLTVFGVPLARRLGRLPPNDTLAKDRPDNPLSWQMYLQEVTAALAAAGRPAEAEAILDQMSQEEGLETFCRLPAAALVARAYRRAEDVEGERRMTSLVLRAAARQGAAFCMTHPDHVSLATKATLLGEGEALRAYVRTAVAEVNAEDGSLSDEIAPRLWGTVGQIYTSLGDNASGEDAFETAMTAAAHLAKGTNSDHGESQRFHAIHGYGWIAGAASEAGETELSHAASEAAFALVRPADTSEHEEDVIGIVMSALTAGSYETARRVADSPHAAPFRLRTRTEIAWRAEEHAAPDRKRWADEALEEFKRVLPETPCGSAALTAIELGVLQSKVGDQETARRLFRWAIRRSNETESCGIDLAKIAERQIEAGLYEDAWETLARMPAEHDRRLRLTVQLAAGVAAREADARQGH